METLSEPKLDKWGTVDGRWIKAEDIDHQHATNIFYYVTFIAKDLYPDWTRRAIRNLLRDRFNGEKLPYVPYYDWEKDHIRGKGFVGPDNKIVIDGFEIGVLN